jgi:hypothetical protein
VRLTHHLYALPYARGVPLRTTADLLKSANHPLLCGNGSQALPTREKKKRKKHFPVLCACLYILLLRTTCVCFRHLLYGEGGGWRFYPGRWHATDMPPRCSCGAPRTVLRSERHDGFVSANRDVRRRTKAENSLFGRFFFIPACFDLLMACASLAQRAGEARWPIKLICACCHIRLLVGSASGTHSPRFAMGWRRDALLLLRTATVYYCLPVQRKWHVRSVDSAVDVMLDSSVWRFPVCRSSRGASRKNGVYQQYRRTALLLALNGSSKETARYRCQTRRKHLYAAVTNNFCFQQ